MTCYVDTSVVLRWLLGSPGIYADFLKWKTAGTSSFLLIEAERTIQRLRLEGSLEDEHLAKLKSALQSVVDSFCIIECNAAIQTRAAGPFPTIIGTLDAIHLSSALLWQAELNDTDFRVVTHDRQMATAAQAIGLRVEGA